MGTRAPFEERRQRPRRGQRFGLPPPLLLAIYCAIALLPLVLAWAQDLPARPWRYAMRHRLLNAVFWFTSAIVLLGAVLFALR